MTANKALATLCGGPPAGLAVCVAAIKNCISIYVVGVSFYGMDDDFFLKDEMMRV